MNEAADLLRGAWGGGRRIPALPGDELEADFGPPGTVGARLIA